MATASELLAAIDTAILDVLQNGQHVASDGLVYTKADLDSLRNMRREYSSQAASGTSNVFDRMKTGVPYRG